ncbi:hypothetical protein JXA70_05165 [candidate division KSB1 bacterium]|nr:hypothetical protein [candidate division KSB1 bacterium]
MHRCANLPVLLLLVLFITTCSYIAPYNQHAYERAIDLKVEASDLVKKSKEDYSKHQERIELFKLEMQKTFEYVKNIPKNDDTVEQYKILMNEELNSMYGFIKFWREHGSVSDFMADEFSQEIQKHFDEIIRLELGKIGAK